MTPDINIIVALMLSFYTVIRLKGIIQNITIKEGEQ